MKKLPVPSLEFLEVVALALLVALALIVLTGCSITVITTKDSAQLTMDNPGLVGVVTGLPEKVKVQPEPKECAQEADDENESGEMQDETP